MLITIFSENIHHYKALVKSFLEIGYEISLLIPESNNFSLKHQNLHIFKGTAADKTKTNKALRSADAVVCLFKKPTASEVDNITKTMKENGVKRHIFLYEESGIETRKLPPKKNILNLFHPSTSLDQNSVEIIRASNQDWTILHPIHQKNCDCTLKADNHIDIVGETYKKTEENFAKFITEQISDVKYLSSVLSI